MPATAVCHRHDLSMVSFDKFKAKYAGMDLSETHRLKLLEDENATLRRLLDDIEFDNVVLSRAILKWVGENDVDWHFVDKYLLGTNYRDQLSDGDCT